MLRKFILATAATIIVGGALIFSSRLQPRASALPPPAGASSRVQSVDGGITNQGYTQLTGIVAATGLTPIPGGANCAMIQAEGDQIRWRDDGTNPTSTVGMFIPAGGSM